VGGHGLGASGADGELAGAVLPAGLFHSGGDEDLLPELRRAIRAKQQIRIGYTPANRETSERQVELVGPLLCGNRWTLGVTCAARSGRFDWNEWRAG